MNNIGETPGNKTIRLGIEAKIKDFYANDDIKQVNALLDVYPHGKPRPEIALQIAGIIVEELPKAA